MDDVERQAKRYLESLGEPALPDGLWDRVEGARRQRMRRRLGGVAVASVAALAFAFAVPGGLVDRQDGPLLAESAPEAAEAPPGDDADRILTVHAIDRALQAAYDRNAADDEIEPLWRARQALMAAATPAAAQSKG